MEQPFLGYFSNKIRSQTRFRSIPFLFAIYLDDIPITRSLTPRSFVILYADDILLIAPSISELQQRLFNNCESELEWLDMRINVKKSHCLRIGPKFNISCARW